MFQHYAANIGNNEVAYFFFKNVVVIIQAWPGYIFINILTGLFDFCYLIDNLPEVTLGNLWAVLYLMFSCDH